jgi:hypothetical protein
MKKNIKHNLYEVCTYLLLFLIIGSVYFFVYGVMNKVLLVIILTPITFCIFVIFLIIIFRTRPYKNNI